MHLKGLTKLKDLRLDATQVTDAGLVHLAGLTNRVPQPLDHRRGAGAPGGNELEALSNDTKITDAGLVHLKGLTSR